MHISKSHLLPIQWPNFFIFANTFSKRTDNLRPQINISNTMSNTEEQYSAEEHNISIVKSIRLISIVLVMFNSAVCFSQWQQTNGPYGAIVSCIRQHENKIYCGLSGGLVVSEDNGTSWSKVQVPIFPTTSVNAIVFVEDTIFIGTSEGVYRSHDNGSTWLSINYGLTNYIVLTMEVLENKLFVGTAQGLYKYTLGLNYWVRIVNGIGIQYISSLQANDDKIYAGTWDNGIYVSSNQGTSWTQLNSGLDGTYIRTLGHCSSGILCANLSGIYLLPDQGTTWTQLALIDNINSISSQGDTIMTVQNWQYPNFSFDGGETWAYSGNIDFLSLFKASLIGNGFYLTGEMGKGIYKSYDGTNWFLSNTGLSNSVIFSLAENNGKVYAATGNMGLYTTENNGETWEQNFEGKAMLVAVNNNIVYVGSSYGFLKSADNGQNWTTINSGLPIYEFTDMLFINNDIYLTLGVQGGVYKLENGSESWLGINNGITDQYVTSIARKSDTIYVGSSNGLVFSTNQGAEWHNLDSYPGDYVIEDILVFNEKIIIVSLDGLFISSDNGLTWIQLTNMPGVSLYETNGKIFIGYCNDGIYRLSFDGTSQIPVNEGIEGASIEAMVSNNDTMISSVHSNGAYKISLSEIISNKSPELTSNNPIIYPNPANKHFFIDCENWQGSKQVKILNLNGQVVLDKYTSESQVEIDIFIKSGIYFAKISNSTKCEVIKFEISN